MRRAILLLSCLALLAGLALVLSALCGSSGCLRLNGDPDNIAMLLQLRVPRALTAFTVGALLAMAGALMQVLLRNPLAEPYVLGVSGGSAAGALLAMLLAASISVPRQNIAAVGAALGAGLAIMLLFGLVGKSLRRLPLSPMAAGHRLLLTGVMLAAGFGAVITLVLTLAADAQLRGMVFWLMGDLEDSRFLPVAALVALVVLLWSMWNAPRLNLLARGESFAQLLGVSVVRLRVASLCAASLATAAAVTMAGTIGFVGLVVPHGLRLLIGNDQRVLLPAAALAGGGGLALADLAARTIVAPTQLPVGVITALIGVPLFLWLLGRSRA
ncbi:ABC-type Fe3+-siderophore transport system, permease component [Herbaspirillum sp. CF444]|uniref:FecCD family ABC transporter permease n=1 Tax=Herbaspirillum sp. CF444 TaxID=1144319 RepID=UPI000272513B|nr:iron ABC transporter permease [Herbaspirillum sp. CF444]EJL94278.1 ABC-type Fe3+-siderophore transport system, permease component [Herbaspirillum sp. CF444]